MTSAYYIQQVNFFAILRSLHEIKVIRPNHNKYLYCGHSLEGCPYKGFKHKLKQKLT